MSMMDVFALYTLDQGGKMQLRQGLPQNMPDEMPGLLPPPEDAPYLPPRTAGVGGDKPNRSCPTNIMIMHGGQKYVVFLYTPMLTYELNADDLKDLGNIADIMKMLPHEIAMLTSMRGITGIGGPARQGGVRLDFAEHDEVTMAPGQLVQGRVLSLRGLLPGMVVFRVDGGLAAMKPAHVSFLRRAKLWANP